ncbi:hypothetical protein FRC10_009877 [Ceratobasidium sp. 414]|nr:hypothetical protein FRC10_009877 [Ceratobasidium sp. 414]
MSNAVRIPDTPPPGWHSIQPWAPRLSLYVHEITSVSVTFILSCRHSNNDNDAALGLVEELGGADAKQKISDVLGKGLAVKVNGTPWQRVVMHVDEESDEEAVVILYGLMPAKSYEIELSVVAGESIKGSLTTEDELNQPDESAPAVAQLTTNTTPSTTQTQTATPAATPPDSPASSSRPTTPPPRQITVEERASQLRHMHSLLTQEHDQLTTQLKTARRDAQRADAALRSEIEALKKAVEKNAVGEQRAKQKILALQEAVKQALAAAVETDNTVKEMERALPELEARRAQAEVEHARASEEAERSTAETKAALDADRKKTAEVEGELASLTARLEKLTAKRDKLAGETVPELEKELAGLHLAIEEVQREKEKEREFNHEIDYPHHYTQPQPLSQPIRRPGPGPGHVEANIINVTAPPFVLRSAHSRGTVSVGSIGRSGPKTHSHAATGSDGFLRGYPALERGGGEVVGGTGRKGSLSPGSGEKGAAWGIFPTS